MICSPPIGYVDPPEFIADCDVMIATCELRSGRCDAELKAALGPPKPARPKPLRNFDVVVRELPALPEFRSGTAAELAQVARIRKLPHADGPALAAHHGTLRFCTAYDEPAWAVMDVENPCNVQLRTMSGRLWFGKTKVMGITGNWAAWPVGLSVALRMPRCEIWLVEGTGDFIAAWHCAADGWGNFVPVAMFGAAQLIHDGALPLFASRRVAIIQQHDAPGAAAAVRWDEQLRRAGAQVRVCVVPGAGDDLNDYVSAGGGDFWNAERSHPRHDQHD